MKTFIKTAALVAAVSSIAAAAGTAAAAPAGDSRTTTVVFVHGAFADGSLTKDEMLDDITLYWLTNSATSSAQLYWENNTNNFNVAEQMTAQIKVPVGVTVFPGELYQAPRTWAERAYPRLTYFNKVDKGGHFAAWEEPQLFAQELRAAFKSLR
ncbi:hypothetical protein CF68_25485 [Cupriavidus sp. SK-4]|nr:hypothetical protein CF68_25485 [Cupriavidus sp. SK-4]